LAGRIGRQGVSRAHDIGGQTGFGPVPLGEDGLPFEHDWEARVYALNGVLRARGLYSVDEFRDAIERIPPQEYLGLSYYERWLRAIETLLAEKALLAGPPQLPDDAPLAGRGRSANREGG
jgi:nitrile hydratase subunit beta